MPAARFFIDAPLASATRIELPPQSAHHAARVLRLRDGETISLFNGHGGEFSARLSIDGRRAFADIGTFDSVERETGLWVTLVQSWIATDKLDWVVEKSVELGVAAIVLAPAARSVVRLKDDRLAKRIERLREVIISACAQCGRNRIPCIAAQSTFEGALQAGLLEHARGLLLEPSAESPLSRNVLGEGPIAVVVGPEGGFEPDEVSLAQRVGYLTCRLGGRTLRTETAGVAALAAIQALASNF